MNEATGSYSLLTAFLHPMKKTVIEDVVRFETEPGEQMQVDFTIIRQGKNPLLAFVATLGWSRSTFVRFYTCQNSAAWCDGIESALQYFGGTPGRDPTFLMNFLTSERSDPYRHLIWTNNEYFQPPIGHSRPKKRRKH